MPAMKRIFFPDSEANSVLSGPGVRTPLVASAIGMAIGCFLILFTIQIIVDLSRVFNKEFSSTTSEYMIVSRKASLLGTLARFDQRFTRDEIEELRKQPFVSEVGVITMSRFKARLTGTESIPFVTELFFESVPDRFLDIIPDNWSWRIGDRTIPLIISRDFLDLYNHGFAVAYNLPQLTPHTVKNLRLSIEVGGERFVAHVAGFSERYNSILVPDSFISWANARFATSDSDAPARLVLVVQRPEHRKLAFFLEEKGYETNREKLKNSRLWNLLVTIAGFAGAGGAAITTLALLVTALSFQLSMTRKDYEIRLLMHLGISSFSIVRYYVTKASLLIGGSALFSLIMTRLATARLTGMLGRLGFTVPCELTALTVASALIVALVSIGCHAVMIRRHIKNLM